MFEFILGFIIGGVVVSIIGFSHDTLNENRRGDIPPAKSPPPPPPPCQPTKRFSPEVEKFLEDFMKS